MLRMIIEDLRLSPGRSFLTGFSMLVGIIAVIVSVLAGTVGQAYLKATTEQLYGRSPTYAASLSSDSFSQPEAVEHFIAATSSHGIQGALTLSTEANHGFIVKQVVTDVPSLSDLEKGISTEVVYTTASYSSVFNVPIFSGRWLTPSSELPRLELVANKAAVEQFPLHSYAFMTTSGNVTMTPMEVVGIVNDGLNFPRIYVSLEGLINLAPAQWQSSTGTFYWHDTSISRTMEERRAFLSDVMNDAAPGTVGDINRSDSQAYDQVIVIVSLSFLVVSVLLLFVSALGLINIGLASIEQRTHELLIRRAMGATRASVAVLVLGSSIILAVLVAIIAVGISFGLVAAIPLLLPADSPISPPVYPYAAALAAVGAAILTALLGSIVPAIHASKLQPALALR